MEKINVAELLKDCPKGMELDCILFDNVTFDRVADDGIWIKHIDSKSCDEHSLYVYNDGSFPIHNLRTKCVIFPKGKTTWDGFVPPCKFKDGDVIYNQCIKATAIFYKQTNGNTISHCFLNAWKELKIQHKHCKLLSNWRLATEEEKAKLFQEIKNKGYKWNEETKTLEILNEPNFKDGDVIACENHWGQFISIFKENVTERNGFIGHCVLDVDDNEFKVKDSASYFNKARLATKREKELLFRAIKKNGYKWNEDTKTLEKLVESKEDTNDEVVVAGIYFNRGHYSDEVELHLGNYDIEVRDGKTYAIFKNKETKESKPKFKVGDKIRHKTTNKNDIYEISKVYDDSYVLVGFACMICMKLGNQDDWELVPDKFDITTLKPFDKVLVRTDNSFWRIGFFEKIEKKNKRYPFVCMGYNKYSQCIPYECNEHLLDTTNDCDEFYKTWK